MTVRLHEKDLREMIEPAVLCCERIRRKIMNGPLILNVPLCSEPECLNMADISVKNGSRCHRLCSEHHDVDTVYKSCWEVTPAQVLERLYESGIDFTIKSFAEDAIYWVLDDGIGGTKESGRALPTQEDPHRPGVIIPQQPFAAAVRALAESAVKHFPDSLFAEWMASNDLE